MAIAAQGLATPRPARADAAALAAMIDRLGVLQIDSVNVLARAHYLPAWSRLGRYDVAALDTMAYTAPRTLFEYWGHMASLLPVELQPLLRWRMARAADHAWGHVRKMSKRRVVLDTVLKQLAERGPIGAGDVDIGKRGKTGWWEWSDAKKALEWLFYSGAVSTSTRRGFERLYDLSERVLPAEVLATQTPCRAGRDPRAGRALGDGARRRHGQRPARLLPASASRPRARLSPRWSTRSGWCRRGSRAGTSSPTSTRRPSCPRRARRRGPRWCRRSTRWCGRARAPSGCSVSTTGSRSTRSAEKRVHGYFVLPLLLDERIVARVDLKAEGPRGARAARPGRPHLEAAAERDAADVAAALREELAGMAGWLGLDGVTPFKLLRATR